MQGDLRSDSNNQQFGHIQLPRVYARLFKLHVMCSSVSNTFVFQKLLLADSSRPVCSSMTWYVLVARTPAPEHVPRAICVLMQSLDDFPDIFLSSVTPQRESAPYH